MIDVKGTPEEISALVASLSDKYPAGILLDLEPAEWHFRRAGIDVRLTVLRGESHDGE